LCPVNDPSIKYGPIYYSQLCHTKHLSFIAVDDQSDEASMDFLMTNNACFSNQLLMDQGDLRISIKKQNNKKLIIILY